MPPRPLKPTPDQLRAAKDSTTVPDILARNLALLLVGINPGMYSGATGHHFARPGNRFWPALHRSGLTPRQLHPSEERKLLKYSIGLTKVVHRATATAAELSDDEVRAGGEDIRRLARRYKPRALCFLGVGTYSQAYNLKRIKVGLQPDTFEGIPLWVLPNPSGLNANYQLPDFIELFTQLRESVGLKFQQPQ